VSGLIQKAIDSVGERGIDVFPQDSPILTGTVPGKH